MNGFNLIVEPCIPCRMKEGASQELKLLNLAETLTCADDITEIVGDSPPVTIALYRLLLAILHRSLGVLGPEAWREVWEGRKFDSAKVHAYLNKWRGRFNLFDERYPFYQAHNVREPRLVNKPEDDEDSIMQLAFQATDAASFFGDRTQSALPSLPAAQAARLLIAFQSFDLKGAKGVEPGIDPDFKSDIAAPLLNSAVALVRGNTLFETLMLNLFGKDEDFFISFDVDEEDPTDERDKPAWERNAPTGINERDPRGYLDLLTWQSRRVRLGEPFIEDGQLMVNRAVVIRGYRFRKSYYDARFQHETMLAFRKNLKRSKQAGFEPLGFDKDKALWRDSYALFQNVRGEQSKPLMLDWLSELKDAGALAEDAVLPIDFLGMIASQGAPKFWRHERLPLPLRFISNEKLKGELKAMLETAENVATTLAATVRRFAVLIFLPDYYLTNRAWFNPRLPKASRADAEKKQQKDVAKSQRNKDIANLYRSLAPELHYWSRLETPFRHLLVELGKRPESSDEAREHWWTTLSSVARQAFNETVGGAGLQSRALRAAAIAEGWFDYEMNRRRGKYLKHIEERRARENARKGEI